MQSKEVPVVSRPSLGRLVLLHRYSVLSLRLDVLKNCKCSATKEKVWLTVCAVERNTKDNIFKKKVAEKMLWLYNISFHSKRNLYTQSLYLWTPSYYDTNLATHFVVLSPNGNQSLFFLPTFCSDKWTPSFWKKQWPFFRWFIGSNILLLYDLSSDVLSIRDWFSYVGQILLLLFFLFVFLVVWKFFFSAVKFDWLCGQIVLAWGSSRHQEIAMSTAVSKIIQRPVSK